MTTEAQDTVRTKILDALLALFPQRDTPESEPFNQAYAIPGFSVVTREPPGQLPTGKTSSLGVYASQTERNAMYPFVNVTMPTVIEIHVSKEQGVEIARTVERYLGVIERVVKLNETLGGLASTIEVTGDNVNIDSPYGQQADGALYVDVKFSQQVLDPTQGR